MVRVRAAGPEGGTRLADRVLSDRVWEDYELVVAGGAGWEERLAAWKVAIVVVQAADAASGTG